MTLGSLYEHAAAINVCVKHVMLPTGMQGRYLDDIRTIELAHQLSGGSEICTLAHELGHAIHRHRHSTEQTEREADEIAAQLLITDEAYARAEKMAENHSFIARELGVTPPILYAYQRILDRSRYHRLRALQVEVREYSFTLTKEIA
ncbi:ImmA/IrrE family metallo-endopeptidase [Lysinibacter sp. HNR]|uniref:ImmA/IrrE family metallo-endopeptidase n=1 Tax=Lysinibacter sp. HNR TaxID=3031408 RepID=UPI002435A127|nr:ImmA/IrrE family metallo-endopeptidase [Lysinibacter sp. HNR]WGD36649.1 ImmA/IrrE family metallo-endopeptidase [Lysinibacter sp. HNR]